MLLSDLEGKDVCRRMPYEIESLGEERLEVQHKDMNIRIMDERLLSTDRLALCRA